MENKILVTGSTGNIGRGIIDLLKAKNANFVAGISGDEAIEGVETVKVDDFSSLLFYLFLALLCHQSSMSQVT